MGSIAVFAGRHIALERGLAFQLLDAFKEVPCFCGGCFQLRRENVAPVVKPLKFLLRCGFILSKDMPLDDWHRPSLMALMQGLL